MPVGERGSDLSDCVAVNNSRYLYSEVGSDVTLIVGKSEMSRRRMPAHSVILAARSPVFDRLLYVPPPSTPSSKDSKNAAATVSTSTNADTAAAATATTADPP